MGQMISYMDSNWRGRESGTAPLFYIWPTGVPMMNDQGSAETSFSLSGVGDRCMSEQAAEHGFTLGGAGLLQHFGEIEQIAHPCVCVCVCEQLQDAATCQRAPNSAMPCQEHAKSDPKSLPGHGKHSKTSRALSRPKCGDSSALDNANVPVTETREPCATLRNVSSP